MIAESRTLSWLPWFVLAGSALAGLMISVSLPLALLIYGSVAVVALLVLPAITVPVLIISSALTRFGIPWGDTQIRLELLVVALLACVLANRLLVRTVRVSSLYSPVLLPLLLYACLNLFSTLIFSTEVGRGLRLDAQIFAAVLIYVAATSSLRTTQDIQLAMKTIWVVTVGEAAAGLIFLTAFVVHVGSFGVQSGDFGLPMVYGTSWEANIFGSFLLGNFFLILADYLQGERSTIRSIGLLTVVAGIGASLTRTVWIGLILGVLIFGALAARKGGKSGPLFAVLAAAPIIALLGLLAGSATPLSGRLLDIVNLHTSSASGRLIAFNAAIADWHQHPVFGSGTGSFNFGGGPGLPHPWLSNLPLLTLHDTGVVGLVVLVLVVVVFVRVALQCVQKGPGASLLVAGSLAGFSALLVAFETTSGFWFAYPWIVMGIGVAAARCKDPA